MSKRKEELLAQLKYQKSCNLIFNHIKETIIVTVPMSDLKDRGKFYKKEKKAKHDLIKMSINDSVNKYMYGSEKYKEKEENVVNFGQDVVLLWHYYDDRVSIQVPQK